jgi:hypothetical protein
MRNGSSQREDRLTLLRNESFPSLVVWPGDTASDLNWTIGGSPQGKLIVLASVAGPKKQGWRRRMRTILIAMLVAAGIGLAGTSGTSAAPASGATINDAEAIIDPVEQVQHWRWGSRGRGGHWRWGSGGGHWRWGSGGGHWRWGSGGRRGGHWRWGSRW